MRKEDFLQSILFENEVGDLKIIFDDQEYDIMFTNERQTVEAGVDELFAHFTINSVIEIGFGLGFTAQKFQDHGVQAHYILEPHPQIAQRAREWRETQANRDNIFIIEEFYQDWQREEEDGHLVRADIVYYDTADWSNENSLDFVQVEEETKQVYFKWSNQLVAGYARQACGLTDYLQKIEFNLNDKIYYQPYKLISN